MPLNTGGVSVLELDELATLELLLELETTELLELETTLDEELATELEDELVTELDDEVAPQAEANRVAPFLPTPATDSR